MIDPTWHPDNVEAPEYFGVAFDLACAERLMAERGCYGLFACRSKLYTMATHEFLAQRAMA